MQGGAPACRSTRSSPVNPRSTRVQWASQGMSIMSIACGSTPGQPPGPAGPHGHVGRLIPQSTPAVIPLVQWASPAELWCKGLTKGLPINMPDAPMSGPSPGQTPGPMGPTGVPVNSITSGLSPVNPLSDGPLGQVRELRSHQGSSPSQHPVQWVSRDCRSTQTHPGHPRVKPPGSNGPPGRVGQLGRI